MKKNLLLVVLSVFITLLFFSGCSDKSMDFSVEVTTLNIEVDNYGAIVYFSVDTKSDVEISSTGVCWSVSPNPTVNDDKTDEGSVTGVGSSQIIYLDVDTEYYIKAYAVVENKIYYGEEKTIFIEDESIRCQAGQLEKILIENKLVNAESIVLSGTIDQRDFVFMRDEMSNLKEIDLCRTTVVAYGEYPANEIPEKAFLIEGLVEYGKDINRFIFPYNTISIGTKAFAGTWLEELSLPAGLKRIGDYAFDCCYYFTGNLVLPPDLKHIGDYAFRGCKKFTGDLILPQGLEYIGENAFYFCSRFEGDLEIPNKIKKIEDGSFQGCSGMNGKLVLPDTLDSIGSNAFDGCEFTGELNLGKIKNIGDSAFSGCKFTGTLILPETLTEISAKAFFNCEKLERLVFSEGLVSIGSAAFSYCMELTGDLLLPRGLKNIYRHAFNECIGLNGTLRIPGSVETIEPNCFYYTSFERVDVYREHPISYVRNMLPERMPVYVLRNSVALYEAASGWKNHPIYALED